MGMSIGLNECVLYNLSCLEEGIDSKSTVHENILKAVALNFIDVIKELDPEKSPAALLQILHERIGLTVVLHNGEIAEVDFVLPADIKKGA